MADNTFLKLIKQRSLTIGKHRFILSHYIDTNLTKWEGESHKNENYVMEPNVVTDEDLAKHVGEVKPVLGARDAS